MSEISGVVVALRTTPIKGLALQQRSELLLTAGGVPGNRAFYVIDERGRMLNGKVLGALCAVAADYETDSQNLTLRFPGGARVAGAAIPGEPLPTRFFSRMISARLVDGPFSAALSAHVGRPLRLVAADPRRGGVDRGRAGAVSLVALASLRRLGELAGREVDPRRFRMLVEVDGLDVHEEDGLVGRHARLGEALVAFRGHVGRCLVATRNPDSGEVDLPTLELLDYRREAPTSEPLAFGVCGEVLEPGRVRLGDRLHSPAG